MAMLVDFKVATDSAEWSSVVKTGGSLDSILQALEQFKIC